jgi:RNA polymerase sigma-70 factor (ECF subfamily)
LEAHETDATLVALARDGDRRAGQILLTRHYPMLVRRCRQRLRDPILAEDAAQEAAVQALLSLDRLRHPDKFGQWLSGIGVNTCRRWMQRRTRDEWSWDWLIGGQGGIEPVEADISPEELIEIGEVQTEVQLAVSELPPGQQAADRLVYLDGLSHHEAALALNLAAGAIKTRLFKARRTLRQRLDSQWMEDYVTTLKTNRWVDFRVSDVRRSAGTDANAAHHSLILDEVGGKQRQAIWGIPAFAAEEIAIQLTGVTMPRPISYALTHQIVTALGGNIREVRIPRGESRIGTGELVIDGPKGEHVLECRVSDAVNLALLSNLPIRYDAAWLTDDKDQDATALRQHVNDELYGPDTLGSADIAKEIAEQFNRATAP